MSSFGQIDAMTAQAAADLRTLQYHILRLTTVGLTNICSQAAAAAADGAVGVLLNKPNSGQQASIGYFGEAKVVAGGSLTANVLITTNGSGRAAAAGSADIVVGRLLETASANGDVVRALLCPPFRMIGT